MRRIHGLVLGAILGLSLLGWAALGWAQSTGKSPATAEPPDPETIPYAVPMAGPSQRSGPAPLPEPVAAPRPMAPVAPTVPLPAAPQSQPAPQPLPLAPVAQPHPLPRPAVEPQPEPQPQPAPAAEVAPEAGPGQTEANPTGRQEPAVSLEWVGPAAAKLGQPADYAVVLRNACNIAVQQVMVRVRLPQGMTAAATEPTAVSEGNVLMWEVGTMLPKQEKSLRLRLVAGTKGDAACQAWVTFTGSSAMRIRVREPKLLLKATAPEKVMVGDAAPFVLTVSNPGDHPAEQVKIHADLSEGLVHARGNKVDFEIGNLAPGETRSVQVICDTRAGGEQKCEATAEADGGLKSADKAALNVIVPRLDLKIAGPKLRYLDRPASYILTVTNPGDASATNVVVSDLVPAGFKFVNASHGGRHDFATRTVSWWIGEVGPGQTREVKLDLVAVTPGEHHHRVAAQASRGLKIEEELVTRVEGLSAILLEVVDIEDPVEVGADTAYEIRVTNTGSKTETDVKLVCTIPDKLQFKSAQAPSGLRYQQDGNEIVFESLKALAPRADAIFRVNVKAIAPGVTQFKTRLTSTNLVEPVHKDEATTIYADGM